MEEHLFSASSGVMLDGKHTPQSMVDKGAVPDVQQSLGYLGRTWHGPRMTLYTRQLNL